MKITNARVIVCRPGRNFVTLKVETDDGVSGIGDATLNGRELAVAAYLEKHVIPCLLGRDAARIEDIWQYLYRGAYWRRGPVTMTSIAAVDVALWDIKAKAAGMPLYQLLGGQSREHVEVYGHANGDSINDTVDEVGRYLEHGYQSVRAQCGVPGLPSTYGVAKDKAFYEPADARLPSENAWQTEPYLRQIPDLFAKLRDTYGFTPRLLHDVHHRLRPIEAARLGRDLEPHRLFWMEDAVPAENQEGFRLIRQHTTTPVAVGEVFNSVWDCKTLIEEQLIDYLRASVVHAGGITNLRRLADFASIHNVRTGCHGATDMSPVTMGAALHFDLWAPNFGLQEYMPHAEEAEEVFLRAYRFDKGFMHPGEAHGHGVDINEEAAAKFPYSPASLPVNRLRDGTMWDW